ncbi:glycoside hydrolase family 5 protein [Macrolepiota fuliginosa MF-IS2]|uniref:glucan 1,3-beta-glucosidase n=1 Tax=Macrolepiota fuliginosa MF-IS2 TaxID=1400762 RepID=A0A9P5XGG8_9AGAR|nr:glycoside hydrolase family 5 protein [Macrolepiota fuliginosa MF-IS2]
MDAMNSLGPSTLSLQKETPEPERFSAQSNQSGELVDRGEVASKPRGFWTRRKIILFAVVLAIVVIVLAVVLPVVLVGKKGGKKVAENAGSTGSPNATPTAALPTPSAGSTLLSGGDGSTVTTENGTSFTYRNSFGGYWVQDTANPFNNDARPNSWTPPLNTSWNWGVDRVYGVNLGGLFVLEPFITPDIFQRYPTASDEFTLSQAMAADTANGGLSQLEDHYATFISEEDIAEMAGAGLNFIRIPIAFWAIETWEGEPYLAKTSWKYLLRVLGWARKYGLRVCLDLHAVPGSQNGYNHSGRGGTVNFLAGNMGLANAERTLYYIRVLTEFISQPEYRDLVPIFGIVNEALVSLIGQDSISSFYLNAHDMIRNITGLGEGNGPYIAIHDGFEAHSVWDGFLQGSDRIMMDQHPYFSFGGSQPDPIDVPGADGSPGGQWPLQACNSWGPRTNQTRSGFGLIIGGEFSASPNDCGLFLNGVNGQPATPGCTDFDDWENYSTAMKQGVENFVTATFDALGDWFFWTWKIGASKAGRIETPLWSYQLGLRNGWIPQDPRVALGKCASLGASSDPFDGKYQPWQTGTPSSIPAVSTSQFPWPPAAITQADVELSVLPTYTNTAPIITMPPATFTSVPSQVTATVDGWFNDQDTGGGIATVAGCPYPDEYRPTFSVLPTAPCTGP